MSSRRLWRFPMQPRSHLPRPIHLGEWGDFRKHFGTTSYHKTISRSRENFISISWHQHFVDAPSQNHRVQQFHFLYNKEIRNGPISNQVWTSSTSWIGVQRWENSSTNLPSSEEKNASTLLSGLALCKETEGQGWTWDLLQHDQFWNWGSSSSNSLEGVELEAVQGRPSGWAWTCERVHCKESRHGSFTYKMAWDGLRRS